MTASESAGVLFTLNDTQTAIDTLVLFTSAHSEMQLSDFNTDLLDAQQVVSVVLTGKNASLGNPLDFPHDISLYDPNSTTMWTMWYLLLPIQKNK